MSSAANFIIKSFADRMRILLLRFLSRFGLGSNAFLVLIAALVGLVTATAAVSFHELIHQIRTLLYQRVGEQRLYGPWIFLLIFWPAAGGLVVGLISRYIVRAREGHGVVDVIESVIRSSGFQRPGVAIEKIVTSAITIGSGGSTGAEGPIVQIGAAIASGIGSLFRVARNQMPTLTGCGAAAGISAIFNSPMGGLLFALEVILQDFSIRSVTPIVVASVIANVATKGIFTQLLHEQWVSIFRLPPMEIHVSWLAMGNFFILGILCGVTGVITTRMMYLTEERFKRLKISAAIRPAIGGAILGVIGIVYVLIFGRLLLHEPKPIPFDIYPMPAFFGDGYGFIQRLLSNEFYNERSVGFLVLLLIFLCLAKIIGTCLTVGSGGSGGIIAPALFVGATVGGAMALIMQKIALFDPTTIQPELYALIGMGAALAAVVHAPLAAILILLELTNNSALVLPAMLATVVATGIARLLMADSIYTLALRRRGLSVSGGLDGSLLHRISVEQVDLDPAIILHLSDPFQKILELMSTTNTADFAVADEKGIYCGMVVAEDVRSAMLERDAIPLLLVEEILTDNIPVVKTTDDLAATMDQFSKFDVGHLPVSFPGVPGRVIGLVSRAALMRRYHDALAGKI